MTWGKSTNYPSLKDPFMRTIVGKMRKVIRLLQERGPLSVVPFACNTELWDGYQACLQDGLVFGPVKSNNPNQRLIYLTPRAKILETTHSRKR